MSGENIPADMASLHSSATAPLKRPVFRALWISMTVSTLGTWMHEVGAGWLIVTLTSDPAIVALVPTASLLPMFVLALPAGALADIVDRRRYILTALISLCATAGVLAFVSINELVNPVGLIALTAAMGTGMALMMPGFQSIVPDLVPRNELVAAVTLNGVAFNCTRTVGPALAGLIIAAAGPGWVFAFNSVSYLAVMTVIFRWRNERTASTLPSERFFAAIRGGVRFATQSRPLQIVILRGIPYFVLVSATFGLLPLIVRVELGYGAAAFGNLMGCVGLGAVIVGLCLARLRNFLSSDALVVLSSFATVTTTLALAYLRDIWVIGGFMVLFGAAWISVLSTLQVNAQLVLPNWVRARGMAMYLASFTGTVAIGAAVWGRVASELGIPTALAIAAITGAAGILLGLPFSMKNIESLDHSPALPIPDPSLPLAIREDEGPVMIEVRYEIDESDVDDFLYFMRTEQRRMRRRNGAITWGLFQEADDERFFVEVFVDESWTQYLRARRRRTKDDMETINKARSYHQGPGRPEVSRKVSRRPSQEFFETRAATKTRRV
jgi:MFS family permease